MPPREHDDGSHAMTGQRTTSGGGITRRTLLRGAGAALVGSQVVGLGVRPSAVRAQTAPDVFGTVVRFADAMVDRCTDRIGSRASGMFYGMLDRDTLAPPPTRPARLTGQRTQDAINRTGSNFAHHQHLHRVLYTLTTITGDARYGQAADRSIADFQKTASPNTKFFAWGEHVHYDLAGERAAVSDLGDGVFYHEVYRAMHGLWDDLHRVDPGRSVAFAQGLWDHQIADKSTGNFSRHARWGSHGPERGREFPRHGGIYIYVWSRAYQVTRNTVFLTAINALVANYERRIEPDGRLKAGSQDPNYWPSHGHSLAVELDTARQFIPAGGLSDRMRALAARLDVWMRAALPAEPMGYSQAWTAGYSNFGGGMARNLDLLRYRQLSGSSSGGGAPVNLAQGKPATQSSTAAGGVASRAVDGNLNGDYSANSVTHTAGSAQPWWQVDLGAVQRIDSIQVYNRTDCCGERLTNFTVFVSDQPFASGSYDSTRAQAGVSAYDVPGQAGRPTTIAIGRPGRHVRVQLRGSGVVSLAEVRVLGPGPSHADFYRNRVLQMADVFMAGAPPRDYAYGWAVTYGGAIENCLWAHELTGEERYLQRARVFAELAVEMFWTGSSPVPRASQTLAHYEAAAGVDSLALAMLHLHVVEQGITSVPKIRVENTDDR
jgi:hypothetical protein